MKTVNTATSGPLFPVYLRATVKQNDKPRRSHIAHGAQEPTELHVRKFAKGKSGEVKRNDRVVFSK